MAKFRISSALSERNEKDGVYLFSRNQAKEKITDDSIRAKWNALMETGEADAGDIDVRRWTEKGFISETAESLCPDGKKRYDKTVAWTRTSSPIYMALGITSKETPQRRHLCEHTDILNDLSPEEISGILQQMGDFPLLKLNLTGGEPTLDPHLCDYIEQAKEHIPRVSITSSGVNIDDEMAFRLACAGLDMVKISINGLWGYHDRFRGVYGAWANAMHAIDVLVQEGIEVSVQTALTKDNANDVLILMNMLARKGVAHQTIVPICPIGTLKFEELVMAPEQYAVFIEDMAKQVRAMRKRGSETNYQVRTVFGGESLFASLDSDELISLSSAHSCEALLNTMEILPNGDVVPCSFIDIPLGNIRNASIEQIWNSKLADETYELIRDKGDDGSECPNCGKGAENPSCGSCLSNRISSRMDCDPYFFTYTEKTDKTIRVA